jgi:hypothetical protein
LWAIAPVAGEYSPHRNPVVNRNPSPHRTENVHDDKPPSKLLKSFGSAAKIAPKRLPLQKMFRRRLIRDEA